MSLASNQLSVLGLSSAKAIENEFLNIGENWKSGRWLQNRNQYLSDTIQVLKRQGNGGVNDPHLRQYIAASTIHHCLDGWSYLGKAINAMMAGDLPIACHLAYYAELRASMSILASQGIGVFSNQHFIVDASGACHLYPKRSNPSYSPGTHVFAWEALEWWVNTAESSKLLGEVIKPAGFPLSDWLSQFSSSHTNSILAKDMLQQWGVDLRNYSDDRDARNSYSYRPIRMDSNPTYDAGENLGSVKSIWNAFEPVGTNFFSNLDNQCLKSSLEKIFVSRRGKFTATNTAAYKSEIDGLLHKLSPPGGDAHWIKMLAEDIGHGYAMLQNASGKSKVGDPKHAVEICSRASILLRLAAGSSEKLLSNASVSADKIRFWWDPLGTTHGLWSEGNEPDNFSDLWADIETSLIELDTWLEDNEPEVKQSSIFTEIPSIVHSLSSCERVLLWGIGL